MSNERYWIMATWRLEQCGEAFSSLEAAKRKAMEMGGMAVVQQVGYAKTTQRSEWVNGEPDPMEEE